MFWLQFNVAQYYTITKHIQITENLSRICSKHNCSLKCFLPDKMYKSNRVYTYHAFITFSSVLAVFWLIVLLLQSGDVHPNPGPDSLLSDSMSDSSSSASSVPNISALSKHLSFVHYNVQSILPKPDVLYTELCDLISWPFLNHGFILLYLMMTSHFSFTITPSEKIELEIAMAELFCMLRKHCTILDEEILSRMVLNAFG